MVDTWQLIHKRRQVWSHLGDRDTRSEPSRHVYYDIKRPHYHVNMAGVRVSGGPLTITISLLLLTLIQVHGQQLKSFTKESYPDPRVNFAACGNSGSSWVCDPGNYLSTAQGKT